MNNQVLRLSRSWLRTRLEVLGAARESGQIGVLILGMAVISLVLILSVVSLTSLQLSRIQTLDVADAAALGAADAVAQEQLYADGLGAGVPLTDAAVNEAAQRHLESVAMPPRVSQWAVVGGTGTPDGRTAVVRVQAVAQVPIVTPVLEQFGAGVTVTVESRGRSDLDG